jgi:hypothetical protein
MADITSISAATQWCVGTRRRALKARRTTTARRPGATRDGEDAVLTYGQRAPWWRRRGSGARRGGGLVQRSRGRQWCAWRPDPAPPSRTVPARRRAKKAHFHGWPTPPPSPPPLLLRQWRQIGEGKPQSARVWAPGRGGA